MTGRYDVVVIGGGLAGLSAALRSIELGATVLVVEKGAEERYACNSRFSGGILHVGYQDPRLPVDQLEEIIRRRVGSVIDEPLARRYAAGSGPFVSWLRGHGVPVIEVPLGNRGRALGLAPPQPLSAGLNWRDRGPDLLLRTLVQRFLEQGGVLMRGSRAVSLLEEAGACVGMIAETPQGTQQIAATATVIADGGFQANAELVSREIAPSPEGLLQRGAATGNGDGLLMAQALGAEITGLGGFYGHLLHREAKGSDRLWPYPELDMVASAGLVVDSDGHRFADEGGGGIYLANMIASRDDPLSATAVFDSRIWSGPGQAARIPPNPHLRRAGATILSAGSLYELAAQARLPAAILVETVAEYNEALATGTLSSLDPPRSATHHPASPVEVPPFYAVPLCVGITYTMGGIRIDGDARVLRSNREPIVGLYAAGSATGGFEGGPCIGYLGGLLRAGIFGLLTAEHIGATLRGRVGAGGRLRD